ncbi:MAG: hypothetical protein J5875_11830 [Paludibacteraceae bacterium]|nr:hypothetical protein [Paludibacteraceae bacterium]
MAIADRCDIRVFETGVQHKPYGTGEDGQTTLEQTSAERKETERLIAIAKANGLFVEPGTIALFGDKLGTKTSECDIYFNCVSNLVFKVKDPFAKWMLKELHAEDAIYEHIVHNLLFPNTRYKFIGISENQGNLRIVLSQPFISSTNKQPSDEEIVAYLAGLGLEADGRYYYGNDYVSVTDVGTASDNVLKGDNGELFFIDPIIKLKKPAPEVIDFLLSGNLSPKTLPHSTQLPWWKALWKRLMH